MIKITIDKIHSRLSVLSKPDNGVASHTVNYTYLLNISMYIVTTISFVWLSKYFRNALCNNILFRHTQQTVLFTIETATKNMVSFAIPKPHQIQF